MKSRCLIDGIESNHVPVSDRGLHYGHGVFETILCHGQTLQFWDRHMARMQRGCQRLNIPLPDLQLLETEALDLCTGGAEYQVVKIVVTRGDSDRGYRTDHQATARRIVTVFDYAPGDLHLKGASVTICNYKLGHNPVTAGIKHLNRLDQVLAMNEWGDSTYDEGILTDVDNYLVSGTMSNLFLVKDGLIYTPDVSRCGIEGVMREVVLEIASSIEVKYRIDRINMVDISTFDELFLTNSLINIMPVKSLSGKNIASPGEVTSALTKVLKNYLDER